jgi:hypothetical protein
VADGPQLEWGLLGSFDLIRAGRMPTDLVRSWQVAQQSVHLLVQPIERLELAGTLHSHPGHVRSDEAKRPFGAIFALAVASRTAAEPLRSESLATAAAALLAWARVYPPTGNPINERFFVPLFQAADLIAADLSAADRRTLFDWIGEFAAAGDRFYAPKSPRNTARTNNWMAWRLLIRAVAATVGRLPASRAELPDQLVEFTARNYIAGPDGRLDGRTYDFKQRDALNYHIAAVQPVVEILLYTPDVVSPGVRAAVLSGLDFVRPYFLGQAQHAEFVGSTIPIDLARRDAGYPAFQPVPWDPARGRVLLRLARPAFPQVRPWTEDIVDARYDPRTKLLAAIYGEPQRRAEWP